MPADHEDNGARLSVTTEYPGADCKPLRRPAARILAPVQETGLYVIERRGSDGAQYWCCSTEHGSGWNPKHPKQAFSKSELSREIFRLAEQGWLGPEVTIRELCLS